MVFLAFIYAIMFVFIETVTYLVTKAALRQSMRLILRPNSEDASRGFWTSSVFFRHHYLVSAKISKVVALFFYLLSTCLLTGKLHGFGGSYADLLLSWATLKDSEMALHCRRVIWWHQKVYWPIVAAVTIINLIYQILRSIDSHMRTREEYKREEEGSNE